MPALIEHSGAHEVAVLPTGSAYERPAHLIEQAERWFETLDVAVRPVGVLTRRDAFDADLAATFRAAKLIYLAGTSAMHLRSVLKDTPVLRCHPGGLVGRRRAGRHERRRRRAVRPHGRLPGAGRSRSGWAWSAAWRSSPRSICGHPTRSGARSSWPRRGSRWPACPARPPFCVILMVPGRPRAQAG